MLPAEIRDKALWLHPDLEFRRSVCGTSAAGFDDLLALHQSSAATPTLKLWMAWEQRNEEEARQRLRGLDS